MSSFIGYGEIGVWTQSGIRDEFLDWFAEHRCQPHDKRWEFCMSEANRWSGCGIDLGSIIPKGEAFYLSEEEFAAAKEFSPYLAMLLRVIYRITKGEWPYTVGSKEAVEWGDILRPSLGEPVRPSFGDFVRIQITRETEALGVAGLKGQVFGETIASISGEEIIGSSPSDFAINVYIEERAREFWFALELMEFLEHSPP
jgi:hypothetical protein